MQDISASTTLNAKSLLFAPLCPQFVISKELTEIKMHCNTSDLEVLIGSGCSIYFILEIHFDKVFDVHCGRTLYYSSNEWT